MAAMTRARGPDLLQSPPMDDPEAPNFIESPVDARVPATLAPAEAAVFIGAFNRAVAEAATDPHAKRLADDAVQQWRRGAPQLPIIA